MSVAASEVHNLGKPKPSITDPSSDLKRLLPKLVGPAGCLLAIGIFFYPFLASNFNLVAGDIGDNRFIIGILEHWRAVAHGQASFRSPNFFWPERGVLGYSESLFLFSIPYSISRAISADAYLAFELSLIAFKCVGFVSMWWVLECFLNLYRPAALFGSILFSISNMYVLSMGHAQLMTVAFLPLLVGILCTAWQASGRSRQLFAHCFAALFGILLAGVLFTSFYIGWFAIVATGVAIICWTVTTLFQSRSISPIIGVFRQIQIRFPILLTAAAFLCVSSIPFMLTYFPTLKTSGGRDFQENLINSSTPTDILNVGQSNWVWGRFLDAFMVWLGHGHMIPSETEVGWPPFTLAVTVLGVFLLAFGNGYHKPAEMLRSPKARLTFTLFAAFVVSWVLSVKVGEKSLWFLVFNFVPGGAAIRVPSRFNIVLNVLVVTMVSSVLAYLAARGRTWRLWTWALALLILVEQINGYPSHSIERDKENRILLLPKAAPSACKSFFVTVPASPNRQFFADQIDAILIARLTGVRTLNGYSGWTPPGWDLLSLSPGYLQNVKRWSLRKHVTSGLCGLNLVNGSWDRVSFEPEIYLPGSLINFRKGGNAGAYELEGWGGPEDGGAWALGEHSSLLLELSEAPKTDLELTLTAHAFTPPQRPDFKETITVNGSKVAELLVTDREQQITRTMRLPKAGLSSSSIQLDFSNESPKSPAELGLSTDARKLGLAFETLQIEPVR